MIPDPLHPAVVHFPIALMILAPLVALGSLRAITRGARPQSAWAVTVALLAALTLSGWVATQTGEREEDRVERVVADRPLEEHEEAAELFLFASAGVLAVGLVGLARGGVGRGARVIATAGTLALVAAGWRVGHSGGELVYQHGAAGAYVPGAASGSAQADATEAGREKRDRDRDDKRAAERGG